MELVVCGVCSTTGGTRTEKLEFSERTLRQKEFAIQPSQGYFYNDNLMASHDTMTAAPLSRWYTGNSVAMLRVKLCPGSHIYFDITMTGRCGTIVRRSFG